MSIIQAAGDPADTAARRWGMLAISWAFLRLGLSGFGGPSAHLALFREVWVERRRLVAEQHYATMLALSQALPGPGSSQVGMMIGHHLGGPVGLLAAFAGFTLPSALVMIAAGLGMTQLLPLLQGGGLQALSVAVFAIVLRALAGMAASLCPTLVLRLTALAVMAVLLWAPLPVAWLQILCLAVAGGVFALLPPAASSPVASASAAAAAAPVGSPRRWPATAVAALVALSVVAVILVLPAETGWMAQIRGWLRAGSLVFGGGHVVLPIIQGDEALTAGLTAAALTAGYALAQAIPGPVFTFAGFVASASAMALGASPILAAVAGLAALLLIFAPSVAFVLALEPVARLTARPGTARALAGVNAAATGLLAATLAASVGVAALGLGQGPPAAGAGAGPGSAMDDPRLWIGLAATLSVTALAFATRIPGWLLVAGAFAVALALSLARC